ncbi:MAG: hypothetical protein NZM04_02475 [Methylacidiphilales bacterium]|nr:hypothetical protein [Candidatus Methylacidiphilales bacterium]
MAEIGALGAECCGCRFGSNLAQAARAAEDKLAERLSAERDGILADLVRAAVDWHAGGLCVPDEIKTETESYRDELDDVRAFVKHCVLRQDVKVNLRDLYRAYTEWGRRTCRLTAIVKSHSRSGIRAEADSKRDSNARTWARGNGIARHKQARVEAPLVYRQRRLFFVPDCASRTQKGQSGRWE